MPDRSAKADPPDGLTLPLAGAQSQADPPSPTLAAVLDATRAHLARFIHFARPEHAVAVTLWAAHSHAPLEAIEQSPILALTSAVKQCGKSRVLDVLEHLVRDPWRISRPSEAVLFRKIDRDHPTVLLDEVDAIFNDRSGATEGVRSLFNSGNRHGTRIPRTVPQGRGFGLVEFDVFCPKATAGIGGLPDTILDRAIVITMERRARHEPLERLRDRQARELGAPIRAALQEHVALINTWTVDAGALPLELDDRAQDGWEPLVAIADGAGGHWPATARAAAVAIFAGRSSADDNLSLRLLADCRAVFDARSSAILSTTDLRTALIALEASAWADVRGREVTPHYLAKLLRTFGITSDRHRPTGHGNPIRGYMRADFEDAWSRYLPAVIGTTDISDTATSLAHDAPEQPVPDVPDVPIAEEAPIDPAIEIARTIWQVFGDDSEYVVGTA